MKRNWFLDLVELYETPEAVCAWLVLAHPLLKFKRPIDVVLGTQNGSDEVARIIDQMQSGSYL